MAKTPKGYYASRRDYNRDGQDEKMVADDAAAAYKRDKDQGLTRKYGRETGPAGKPVSAMATGGVVRGAGAATRGKGFKA